MLALLRKFDFLGLEFLRAIFSRDESAAKAKERLRMVLVRDQSSIHSELLQVIRRKMIGAVSRYLEIDLSRLKVGIERQDSGMALAVNVPILRIRKEGRVLAAQAKAGPEVERKLPQTARRPKGYLP